MNENDREFGGLMWGMTYKNTGNRNLGGHASNPYAAAWIASLMDMLGGDGTSESCDFFIGIVTGGNGNSSLSDDSSSPLEQPETDNPLERIFSAINCIQQDEGNKITGFKLSYNKHKASVGLNINYFNDCNTITGSYWVSLPQLNHLQSEGNSWGFNFLEKANSLLSAISISLDLVTDGMTSLQKLANKFGGTAYILKNLGNYELLKIKNFGSLTISNLSKALNGAAVGVPIVKMLINGQPDWENGTDAVMGGFAFYPGVGWVISGGYFFVNEIVKGLTGHSVGYYLSEVVEFFRPNPWDRIDDY